ncbi:hypothetical protein KCP69_06170 [Salmonella enterica subsp. enterica]|nr:hypothetical protein KCP69_06170 [Salmonella enterica subsp. enterica]
MFASSPTVMVSPRHHVTVNSLEAGFWKPCCKETRAPRLPHLPPRTAARASSRSALDSACLPFRRTRLLHYGYDDRATLSRSFSSSARRERAEVVT